MKRGITVYFTQSRIAALSFLLFLSACSGSFEMETKNKEANLLGEIKKTPVGPARDSLIDELEKIPAFGRSFFERWFFIHFDYSQYENCWSDHGFDPSKSKFPRDVLLLAAADYGKSDIDNGGFHQFFFNHTGTYAPEVAEWFEKASFDEAANIVRQAMNVFGPEFPRSQHERQQFLGKIHGDSREQWDPFYELDDQFYDVTEDELYETAANKWLRDTCGIKKLKQRR